MIGNERSHRPTQLAAAALLAAGVLAGGCVHAGPPAHVVVRPPVVIGVTLTRPGWDYFQYRSVWYYAPRQVRHPRHLHHDYYVLRGGAWVYVR